MDAYLNELSVRMFSNREEAKDAFQLLGNCLKKMQDFGIMNVRMTNIVNTMEMLGGQSFYRILENKAVIDTDLKSVLMAKLCSLEPVDELENTYNVLNFTYNDQECKGLGWASEQIENTVALGFYQRGVWDKRKYTVQINLLDEEGETVPETSDSKHISTPDDAEACRDFFEQLVDIPSHGKVLAMRVPSLFPHLLFASQAMGQLKKQSNPLSVRQIFYRLQDLEKVAVNCTSPIRPTDFGTKTTPESDSRENLPQLRILFEDGQKRLCSWHSRFTPGKGRIHFCPDESNHLFYVGYIGEKICPDI